MTLYYRRCSQLRSLWSLFQLFPLTTLPSPVPTCKGKLARKHPLPFDLLTKVWRTKLSGWHQDKQLRAMPEMAHGQDPSSEDRNRNTVRLPKKSWSLGYFSSVLIKNTMTEARELVRCFKALVVLAGDPGSISSTPQ